MTANRDTALEALENRHTPLEQIKEIFERFSDDAEVIGMVAMNLSQRTSVYDRELGKSPIMTELLIALADTKDMGARWAVAKNPHTPPHVLEHLAEDPVNLVRALAATNPNTSPATLEKLFGDEKIVRDGLSGNPSTPVKYLDILADDSDKMVRMRVAENPSTPEETLNKLLNDTDENVIKAAEAGLKKMGR